MALRGIFRRNKKEVQQTRASVEAEEDFKVILKTEKVFSEEQKKAISTMVSDGVKSGLENSAIAIGLILNFDLSEMVILNRYRDGIEVII